MFKKIFTLIFALAIIVLFSSNITQAQPTKTKGDVYPVFSLAPLGGVQFPVAGLNNTYNAGWNAGLDLNLKINRETSIFLNGTYFALPIKTDLVGGDASYIGITAGPRYIFTSKNIKAQIFLEMGLGAYIYNVKEYTSATQTIPSVSTTSFGVNVGPGALIPLGKAMDLMLKAKLHDVLASDGSTTFISIAAGLDFKF